MCFIVIFHPCLVTNGVELGIGLTYEMSIHQGWLVLVYLEESTVITKGMIIGIVTYF